METRQSLGYVKTKILGSPMEETCQLSARIRPILADDIPSKKKEGGSAGNAPAKIRLNLANNIPSKKREGEWAGLVPAKILASSTHFLSS